VIVVVVALLLLFFVGGFIAARRRASRPEVAEHIRDADRALEQARATDRGWHRDRMAEVAARAIGDSRPEYAWEDMNLVLVEDRPGVTEDRAHLVASGPNGQLKVILARREGGEWFAEQVE
jgi:hypothetical protein